MKVPFLSLIVLIFVWGGVIYFLIKVIKNEKQREKLKNRGMEISHRKVRFL
tara:strand:- start:1 stop:153 length:153 start_codon:yes stop_codon:yes gene_type:complete